MTDYTARRFEKERDEARAQLAEAEEEIERLKRDGIHGEELEATIRCYEQRAIAAETALATFELGEDIEVMKAALDKVRRLEAERDELKAALETIGGGHTTHFPGAPNVMTAASPEAFRSDMWTWSQKVARAALAELEEKSDVS